MANTIIVRVEGGVLQSIHSDDPNLQIALFDFDDLAEDRARIRTTDKFGHEKEIDEAEGDIDKAEGLWERLIETLTEVW